MQHEQTTRIKHEQPAGLFPMTRWSVVLKAKADENGPLAAGAEQGGSLAALNALFGAYRHPLLVYLRGRGYGHHDAEDCVQGFAAHLLQQDFLARVSPEKGGFRTFLLESLKNYLLDQRDREMALKRGGGMKPGSLDEEDAEGRPLHDPASLLGVADMEYDRTWARTILNKSLRQLEAECAPSGHGRLFKALEPTFFRDEAALAYGEIGRALGMSEANVKTAAHRLRERLGGIIREEVMQTVSNRADWKEEMHYLMSLFERPDSLSPA